LAYQKGQASAIGGQLSRGQLINLHYIYIGYVRDSIFAFDRFDKFDDFDNTDNYEDDINRCNNLHVRFDKHATEDIPAEPQEGTQVVPRGASPG
jgi:hypothetical protein